MPSNMRGVDRESILFVKRLSPLLAVGCFQDDFLVSVIRGKMKGGIHQLLANSETLTMATHGHAEHLTCLRGIFAKQHGVEE